MIIPSVESKWLKIGFLLPTIALNGWVLLQIFQYFEPLVTIFVIASVLAFILNYPVEILQGRRLRRSYAIAIVLLASLIALVAVGVTLLPALLEQLSGIVSQLPDWMSAASQRLQIVQDWASAHRLPVNLNRVIRQITSRIPEQIEGLGDETVLLTLNAAGGLSSLVLTLVLAIYLLLDGKRVWNALFGRLPLKNREQVQRSLQNDFHSYFIGQATLGLITGTLLSLAFFVLHVPYSLLLGSTIGLMSLIPLGDVLSYFLASLFLAAQSPTLAVTTLVTAVLIDQLVDQAIAPRILGGFTGLKPVWIIIALLLGTKLFGLPGLLIAVPIASFINTLLADESSLDDPNAIVEPDAESATSDGLMESNVAVASSTQNN